MAIENGVVLAQAILAHDVPAEAFKAFEERRFEHVRHVIETSVTLSRMQQAGEPRSMLDNTLYRALDTLTRHIWELRMTITSLHAGRPRVEAACKLVLHPDKMKIVCKDANRRGGFPVISFDFPGFQFRARKTMWGLWPKFVLKGCFGLFRPSQELSGLNWRL